MADPKPLRLLAYDADDLSILSAAVQDAVLKADNIRYSSKTRRLSIEVNRFQWENRSKRGPFVRVRSLLAFDGVLGVRTRAVTKTDPDMVLSLLKLDFAPDETPPGGKVSILFSGDGELELDIETLDVSLLDSDYEWTTNQRPDHYKKRR